MSLFRNWNDSMRICIHGEQFRFTHPIHGFLVEKTYARDRGEAAGTRQNRTPLRRFANFGLKSQRTAITF